MLLPESTIAELTDDEATGEAVEERVQEAIASADAEIDASCGTRYKVPLSPAPSIIKKLSVDIAIYNLYSRKAETVPQARAERYRSAMMTLKAVSDGSASLGDAEANAEREDEAMTNTSSASKVFTRESLDGY